MEHYRKLKINESEMIVKTFMFTLGERDRDREKISEFLKYNSIYTKDTHGKFIQNIVKFICECVKPEF